MDDDLKAILDAAKAGPWTIDYHGVDDCLGDVWTEFGYDEERICENAAAEDARLIAMAPDLAAEVVRLRMALANAMGYLDTPIARRKLAISADEPWLQDARAALKGRE